MTPTIALIAHDGKKNDLVAFIRQYTSLLSRYRLLTTSVTGQRIQEDTGLLTERVLPGAVGGVVQIAAQVAIGEVIAVVFLVDPLYVQPHEPNLQTMLHMCEIHNVPIAVNLATAEAIMERLVTTPIAHLIFNPVSGQGNPDHDLQTIRQFLERKIHLYIHQTTAETCAEDLAHQAIAFGADFIIASGGDGTVSAVAEAVIGTGIPLGVIPRGTANAFAGALGIPTTLQGACETILAQQTRVVDAARCNGLPMVLLSGIGFEAEMVERANREAKDRFGALAYILAGVQQLNEQQLFTSQIAVDGTVTEVQAATITVANAAPPTSVLAHGLGEVIADDGLLEVTIGAPTTKLQAINTLFQLFGAALIKIVPNRDDMVCFRTKRLTITTDPPQKVVVDGEIIGTTPVEIECLPGALTVLAPQPIRSKFST